MRGRGERDIREYSILNDMLGGRVFIFCAFPFIISIDY